MQISQIRYFVAVCEEKTFSAAARKCGVSQPSVTSGIRQLESEVGDELFHRGRATAELTALGRRLEPHFSSIWRSVRAIEAITKQVTSHTKGRANPVI